MSIIEKYTRVLELDKILLQLAEYTCCEYAKNIVLNIKPNTNLAIVKEETTKTNDALYLASHFGTPSFSKMDNPIDHLKLAQVGGVLSPRNLLNIATILRQVRLLQEWFTQCQNHQNSLKSIFEMLIPNKELEKRINTVFLSEDEIDDFASEELLNIRRKIKQLGAKIKEDLDKMIRSSTYQKALQENIITMRDGRYVLPVKAEYKGVVSGLVHDTSSSGATLFIEPISVVEANNDIRVLKSKEKAEIERILAELSAYCGDFADSISRNFEIVICLNIYFAKASLAVNMKAMLPIISNDGKIKLNKARHPLISKDTVVPISIELGYNYTSLVITGPNTGGKTVTLKTLGLLTLMTMCGLLIPVSDDSVISIFDNILVDIGDEQSIAQNLSTFSAHMTNIVSILDRADAKSLVLVDELGSGTDPVEGAAIATAILEQLRERKTIVAATTHYAELKVYALQTKGVMNASCEFDVKTLKPTYRLLIGTPGRSNAFEISRKLGLSESILNAASEYIAHDKKNFEDVIDGLESSRQDYEEKSAQLAKEARELKQLKEDLKNLNQKAIDEKEKIIEKARQEASRIVDNVKLDSQLLIDELDKIRKEKDKENFSTLATQAKSQVRGRIDKLQDKANPVVARTNEDYVLPRKLKKGDTVLIVDIDKNGVVLEDQTNAKTVLVQAGIMKSRVDIKNLRLTETKKVNIKGKTTRTISSNKTAKANMELDLRGQTVEEAIMELDMFINQSILSNIAQVTIIHGKGTGALRSAVHSYLKQSKYIKTFRLGVFGEGEAGVTIAEIK
ncbi:endonuclease MutS2 [Paludicola sp. MB14-C6]|uniref:endonuclease MutS2 n=1 Tax=Paludihabitans sp. MB14-C6 TaxID=3070656 RepID=UPI0027DDA42B|nr:endonuclease MutS2 [Paludicola sp. MB14-C6]WMJ23405.1 endonuclease MutS2 [Paludicola sp. MB14-C6]